MSKEIRSSQPAHISESGGTVVVEGYAAVFGQEADIGGMFREVIMPGAFRNAIGRDDVMFLVNHSGLPLARTRSGTLTLSEDDYGLKIRSELDLTDPDVLQIVPKMRRADLDKMSFAFRATEETWVDGSVPLRTIHQAQLFDVSIVSEPAYAGTEIGLRGLEASRNRRHAAARVLKRKAVMDHSLRGLPA